MKLLNILYSEKDEFLRGREEGVSPDEKQTIITHIIPDKFRDDIRSLTDYVGEASFQSELCIEVSLAELLKVVPRKRRRRDAYDTLVKYLKEERNITLKINKK